MRSLTAIIAPTYSACNLYWLLHFVELHGYDAISDENFNLLSLHQMITILVIARLVFWVQLGEFKAHGNVFSARNAVILGALFQSAEWCKSALIYQRTSCDSNRICNTTLYWFCLMVRFMVYMRLWQRLQTTPWP